MATRITRYQHSLWKRTAFASPIAASEKRRACPSYSINTLWVTLIAGILLSQMAWLKDAKSSFSITLEWLVQRERFREPSRGWRRMPATSSMRLDYLKWTFWDSPSARWWLR